MGHLIKVERFGLDQQLEGSEELRSPGWEGVWDAVEAEMDRTGRIPNEMGEWGESACVTGPEHGCDGESEVCRRNLKAAIREWVRSELEGNDLKTGSFCFAGADWSAVTYGWDGS
jgi:hypothetical protein